MSEDSGMTITEFLEARIAEDEASAHAVILDATTRRLGKWEEGALEVGEELPGPQMTAKFSPARVLAECAAKRAIIELVRPYLVYQSTSDTSREFLQVLAAVYKDHPDYHPEWAL